MPQSNDIRRAAETSLGNAFVVRSIGVLKACLTHLLIGVVAVCAAGPAHAQAAARELLNSERIVAAFGSYGIEVIEATSRVRVSNLYSLAGAVRTCRTFAVVSYPSEIDSKLAEEHEAILKGGSIGATFAANGWQVRKTHLHYGEITASPVLAELMQVDSGVRLAEHAYVLDVVKDGHAIEYAALVEIHHPDYLRLSALETIYGPAAVGGRAEILATLLATAAERSQR